MAISAGELDALEPTVIHNLIEETISDLIDWDLWEECMEKEAKNKKYLERITKDWDKIISKIRIS